MINAVYPLEMYEHSGIVSYNFGGHANELAVSYWLLINALNYTHPKLVVIDCMGISSNVKTYSNFSYLHQSFDAFPLSLTKIKAVYDLLDDKIMNENILSGNIPEKSTEPRTKIGLLFPYSVYHARWNQLTQEDFVIKENFEKGAEMRINTARLRQSENIGDDLSMTAGTVGELYLNKILDLCSDKEIDVLLTYLPYPNNQSALAESNYLYYYSQENGVNYLNFLDNKIIDSRIDFYDEDHLNPSGARKISTYLSDYLNNSYNLPDRRNSNFGTWDDDLDKYILNNNQLLTEQEDLITYLMLLYDNNVECKITIGNPSVFSDEQIIAALNNIGVDYNILLNKAKNDGDYVNILALRDEKPIDDVCFYYYLDENNKVITTKAIRKE